MGESTERAQSKDGMPGGRKKVEKKRLLLRIDPALHDELPVHLTSQLEEDPTTYDEHLMHDFFSLPASP